MNESDEYAETALPIAAKASRIRRLSVARAAAWGDNAVRPMRRPTSATVDTGASVHKVITPSIFSRSGNGADGIRIENIGHIGYITQSEADSRRIAIHGNAANPQCASLVDRW